MLRVLGICTAFLATVGQGPKPPQSPVYRPDLPEGAVRYTPAKYTQSIFKLSGERVIRHVPITEIDSKWNQSGGMEGIKGFSSAKYKTLPKPERELIGDIEVKNGHTHRDFNGSIVETTQKEHGRLREYADGSRFDDVLSNADGVIFEHRVREKLGGKWTSKVAYSNPEARPAGYTGLTVTCASCHDKAGTGGYAVGLVPGGDTVLSDPFDW